MVPDGHAAAVIVLAAGEGSRMRSAIPKVLHPVAGRPLVEHAVRAAAGLDPRQLAVVVGHGREAVTTHLHALAAVLGRAIDTPVQPERNGTGHAVSCALDILPADPGVVTMPISTVQPVIGKTVGGGGIRHAGIQEEVGR